MKAPRQRANTSLRSAVGSVALIVCAMSGTGCSGGDDDAPPPPPCVENLNTSCLPLHQPPIYSTIYAEIIQKQCATGSSCHSAGAAMGGLVLDKADDTYDTLLGVNGGTKRVLPRDPACSPLMLRLTSRDPNYVMPKGSRLLEPEICDFVLWIKEGAQKN
jgi:hypothetical protein